MTTSTTEERLVTGYAGRLLVGASVGWLAIQAGRLVLSPTLPAITADLGITDAQAGFAFTLMWGLYALCQYPSGRLSDVLSRKTLLTAGLGCIAIGFVTLASAQSYLVFLIGSVIVGAGAGFYPTAARALVSDLYTAKRGRAFGLHTASGDLGGMVAAGLAAVVLAVATWREAFVPVVIVILGVLLSLHLWSRESYVFERRSLRIRETLSRLLGAPRFRWLLVAYSLYAFAWQSVMTFLPTYLIAGKGFDPIVGQIAFAVLFGVGAIAKPAAGWLADRVSRRTLSAVSVLLAAVSLTGVVLAHSPLLTVLAVVVFSVGLMSYPPVMQAHLMDSFPADSAGGDLGATRTVYLGLGALGPTYIGLTATYINYRVAFLGLVASLLVSAVIILADP